MVLLSKKNKDKLVGGIIVLLLGALGLIINNWLKKEPQFPKTEPVKNTVRNNLSDSAKQTDNSNNVTQKNENKGNVNNDFSRDKKITNQYFPKETKVEKRDSTPIVNNGIINNGGIGNTYNQTVRQGEPQRHLTQEDKRVFDNWVASRKVLFTVSVYNYDKESIVFAEEIVSYLKSKGALQAATPIGECVCDYPRSKTGQLDWAISNDSSLSQFIIYPLK